MLEADLPVDPPVQFGSMQAYALCTVRNYVMMAIHEGCTECQICDVVSHGIERAIAAARRHARGGAV
jgi:hypothetical protein